MAETSISVTNNQVIRTLQLSCVTQCSIVRVILSACRPVKDGYYYMNQAKIIQSLTWDISTMLVFCEIRFVLSLETHHWNF